MSFVFQRAHCHFPVTILHIYIFVCVCVMVVGVRSRCICGSASLLRCWPVHISIKCLSPCTGCRRGDECYGNGEKEGLLEEGRGPSEKCKAGGGHDGC